MKPKTATALKWMAIIIVIAVYLLGYAFSVSYRRFIGH